MFKTFLLFLVFTSVHLKAQTPTCPKDLKIIAKELVELQLSGAFLAAGAQCLKQENFKTVLAAYQGPQEEEWKAEVKFDQKKIEIRLGEIKEINLGIHSLDVYLREGKKMYKDSFSFILLHSDKEPLECAGILEPFKRAYIYKHCDGE